MECIKRDFLDCPSQYKEMSNTCGCLLINYLPKVDECNVDIKIIAHLTKVPKPEEKNNWLEHMWMKFKRLVSLKIESTSPLKRMATQLTLLLLILTRKYQRITSIIGIFMLIALMMLGNIFLFGLFAFAALLIYIPIMQINNDLKNYCVINVLHQRTQRQNDDDDIIKTEICTLDSLRLYHTIYKLKKGSLTSVSESDFTTYELSYIEKVIDSIQHTSHINQTLTVLAKKHQDSQYKIYEIRLSHTLDSYNP